MDRHSADVVRVGAAILRESFQALHSVVKSDRASLSRVTSGWPQVFLDADEILGQTPEEPRRQFTARQVTRAERLCQVYTSMRGFDRHEKRDALYHVMAQCTWRQTSEKTGRPWPECRRVHDSLLAAFAYHVARHEGVELGVPTVVSRAA